MAATNFSDTPTIVVGAGIGGLAAAARLAAAGRPVLVLERHAAPGGKMRTVPTASGPADTGPTVLTMRCVFDDLFAAMGARLEDHVTLHRQHLLARHFWPDGATLDLFDSETENAAAIDAFAGPRAADQFRAFSARARRLYQAFDRPMMQTAEPRLPHLAATVLRRPRLMADMAPHATLAQALRRQFDDPRLAQLFGRFATYVGGSPYAAPALLALIWQAEAAGVWVVEGGMHALAAKIARLAEECGAQFRYDTHVARIETDGGRAVAVSLADGTRLPAAQVLFNGDPRALATGALGPGTGKVAQAAARAPRSLSAQVWAFAAQPSGRDLAHHNVFFSADYAAEFADLRAGRPPADPTLYICAQDRGLGRAPPAQERFEIIVNAPPLEGPSRAAEEYAPCLKRTFDKLNHMGLAMDPLPGPEALTTPGGFESLFPASLGALYGQSPHGMTAALGRPRARTKVAGLYLAGGGAHPGAGVPMAALSGRHAAEAMLSDRTSTSTSRPTATRGGTSTASRTTAAAPSPSSAS
ncbi:1-hydroxycarotenoid 3,4-desaturase CrtD [Rhodosalinus sp. K401]|uniref:1-hydroxycarotenoid 3,4-desaturase CrtD n=1 Tax=Rhodosalinus sp. K401 TaxID=3239195 RepID=UPI003523284E